MKKNIIEEKQVVMFNKLLRYIFTTYPEYKNKQDLLSNKLSIPPNVMSYIKKGKATFSDYYKSAFLINFPELNPDFLDGNSDNITKMDSLFDAIKNSSTTYDIKTNYHYQLWEKPIITKNDGVNIEYKYDEPDMQLIFPDGERRDISYSDFLNAEKQIMDFIDFTFSRLKEKSKSSTSSSTYKK